MAEDAAPNVASDIPQGEPKTTSHLHTVTAVAIMTPPTWRTICHKTAQLLKHRAENRDQRNRGKADAVGMTGFYGSDHLYLKETIRSAERWSSRSSFISPGSSTGIWLYLTCVFS